VHILLGIYLTLILFFQSLAEENISSQSKQLVADAFELSEKQMSVIGPEMEEVDDEVDKYLDDIREGLRKCKDSSDNEELKEIDLKEFEE